MSATINDDAVAANANQPGEFGSKVPPTGPQQTTGHQPGRLVSEADRAPEFQAEILPAGTAPPSKTFAPQNESDIPGQGDNPTAAATGNYTSASATLGGATSADVHTGLGHPGQGQSSQELHHDGQPGNKHVGGGLQGVGASGAPQGSDLKQNRLDTEAPIPGATQKLAGGQDHNIAKQERMNE